MWQRDRADHIVIRTAKGGNRGGQVVVAWFHSVEPLTRSGHVAFCRRHKAFAPTTNLWQEAVGHQHRSPVCRGAVPSAYSCVCLCLHIYRDGFLSFWQTAGVKGMQYFHVSCLWVAPLLSAQDTQPTFRPGRGDAVRFFLLQWKLNKLKKLNADDGIWCGLIGTCSSRWWQWCSWWRGAGSELVECTGMVDIHDSFSCSAIWIHSQHHSGLSLF